MTWFAKQTWNNILHGIRDIVGLFELFEPRPVFEALNVAFGNSAFPTVPMELFKIAL